jgi:hypothetical protein
VSACPPLSRYPAVLAVPLVPAVDMPAWDEVGAPAVVGDVLVGAVGGVVVDGVVVLGGIADPGAELGGGIGAVGVGDVVVGDAVVGAVVEGLVVEGLVLDGMDDDPVALVIPGALGEPALPIVGFARTNEGVAVVAPAAELAELAGEVTHPVTVTICPPLAPLAAAPGVVDWVCAAAPTTMEAASAVANAICLFMTVLS